MQSDAAPIETFLLVLGTIEKGETHAWRSAAAGMIFSNVEIAGISVLQT